VVCGCFPFISTASNAANLSPEIYYIFKADISLLKPTGIVTNWVVPSFTSSTQTLFPQISFLMQQTNYTCTVVAILLLLLLLLLFNCNWINTRWQWYSTHLHTNSTQNTEDGAHITIKKKNLGSKLGSAGRAPSLRVTPWYLPYNWGKSTEKPQLG
jgi:hypothetical protein